MTGLLLRLAERTLGVAPSVRPFAPRFAPEPRVGAMELDVERSVDAGPAAGRLAPRAATAPLAIASAPRGPAPGFTHTEPLAPQIERVVIERPVPTSALGSAASIDQPVAPSLGDTARRVRPAAAAEPDSPRAPDVPPEIHAQPMDRLLVPARAPVTRLEASDPAPGATRPPREPGSRDHDGLARVAGSRADAPRASAPPPILHAQPMDRLLVPARAPVTRLEASDPAPGATRPPREPGSRDHDHLRGLARVAGSRADAPRASAPPPIRVTIGRVEVRAVVPAPQARRAAAPATPPPVSLDEYLRRRDRGDR